MNARFSCWLIPAEPHKSELRRVISELSRRFRAPVFEPHVTLYSGFLSGNDDHARHLAEVSRAFPRLTLRVTGVGESDRFTKTLFLELERTAELTALAEALKSSLTAPESYDLQPHLSLVYAKLDVSARRQLQTEFRDISREIGFDTLQCVSIPETNETHADVKQWRTIGTARLNA